MFDSSHTGPLHWPDAPSAWVCAWLKTAHDLVLVLDAQGLVLDVIQNDAYQPCDLRPWIGQHFRSLVDDDSVGKVDALWAHDASDAHVHARWRHLNLMGPAQEALPVMALCLSVPEPALSRRLLVCRDLGPAQELNRRYLEAYQELQQTLEAHGLTRPVQSPLS